MEQWDSKVDPDLKSGDSDQCIIYIALCTKNYEIRTNPKSRQLFDPNDASVIAYGELVAKEAVSGEEANGYKKFSIDIKYRKTDVTPSYIVVVLRQAAMEIILQEVKAVHCISMNLIWNMITTLPLSQTNNE